MDGDDTARFASTTILCCSSFQKPRSPHTETATGHCVHSVHIHNTHHNISGLDAAAAFVPANYKTLSANRRHTKVNNKSSIILLLQPNRSPGKLSVCTVHTLGRFTTKRISKTKYIFYCIMDITLFILLQFFGSVPFYFIFLFLLFLSKAYGKEHLNFSVVLYGLWYIALF